MLSVYQHWDPLKVCLVGRSYPPEFYSFIKNPKVRSVMERIAMETEEDYQKLIALLEKFGVKVFRVDMSDNPEDYYIKSIDRYFPPPMCPRDHAGMFGNNFFVSGKHEIEEIINSTFLYNVVSQDVYNDLIKKKPVFEYYINNKRDDENKKIVSNILETYFIDQLKDFKNSFPVNPKVNAFKTITEYVRSQGNNIILNRDINTASSTRIGKDLYHGMNNDWNENPNIKYKYQELLPNYRHHIIPANSLVGGHTDATFCPVKHGLILTVDCKISNELTSMYDSTFPNWDIVELPGESWSKVGQFLDLKEKNGGKWWVPGEELNDDFTDFVESWLNHWVLYVEESVFDVNILVIDEKNVVCNGYNKIAFDAFERHGITPHVINFRHRYFWDGGLHCITLDIDREGEMHDYFPERKDGIYVYLRKD